jgi:hypothetical protein
MKDRIEWIEHKGKKILFCDFTKLTGTGYMEGVDAMDEVLLSHPAGTQILALIDITDSRMSTETRKRGEETRRKIAEAGVSITTSLVGFSGMQRIIIQAISRNVNYAADIESAKDWLVSR